jgi:hypothetical protein
MLNLNEVPVSSGSNEPLTLIPDGTIARGVLMFQGGDQMMPEFSQSAMFFKKSAHTSAVWMPIEMTIVGGQYDKRKVWQNIFIHGDAIDEATGVSKARMIGLDTIRKILNSGHNLDANDMSPEAQAKRQINGVEELQGLEVCFVIGIEKSNDPQYADKNRIKTFLSPDSGDFIAPNGSGGASAAPALSPMPPQVQQAMNAQMPAQQAQSGVTPAWAQK